MFGRSKKYTADGHVDTFKADDYDGNSIRAAAPPARSRKALGDITNSIVTTAPASSKDAGPKKLGAFAQVVVSNHDNVVTEMDVAHAPPSSRSPTSGMMDNQDRPYMQREADNIDIRDTGNPLLCTSVVNEMYEYFAEVEKLIMTNPAYMSTSQPHINERMRCILIDWLVEVHLKFKMVPETLYLTVQIIDRFLETTQVRRSKLQLVGVAALLVASKYEEIYPPELRDLVYITDRAYNKQEILEMETLVVNALEYNLTVPTIHSFLCRFLKAAHADRTMVQLACYLAERTLQEYSMVKFLPSVIAASSVYVARKSLRRHPWSPTLVRYTSYDEADLMACVEEMRVFIDNSTAAQQAVVRKYSSPKFGAVAKMTMETSHFGFLCISKLGTIKIQLGCGKSRAKVGMVHVAERHKVFQQAESQWSLMTPSIAASRTEKLMERQCSERYRWSGSPHSVSRNRKKVCLFPLLKFWSPRNERRSCTSEKLETTRDTQALCSKAICRPDMRALRKLWHVLMGMTGAASEKKLEACGVEEFTEDKKDDNNTEVSSIVTRIMMLLTELLSYDDAYGNFMMIREATDHES
eukprot:gene8985-18595_t